LDSRVHVESGDEVEDLAHEINRMAEELQATARSRADFLARVIAVQNRQRNKNQPLFCTGFMRL